MYKTIEQYPEYKVDENGHVMKDNELIRVLRTKYGYMVRLKVKEKYKFVSVGKLVALAFIGEPETPSDVIAYKDGNNLNPTLENIMWSSRSEAYAKAYRTRPDNSKNRIEALKKVTCKPIMAYKSGLIDSGSPRYVYSSITEASKSMGVSTASISRCLKYPKATCMGYHWKEISKEEYYEEYGD